MPRVVTRDGYCRTPLGNLAKVLFKISYKDARDAAEPYELIRAGVLRGIAQEHGLGAREVAMIDDYQNNEYVFIRAKW